MTHCLGFGPFAQRSRTRATIFGLFGLSSTGCLSSTASPEPLESFESQALSWQACDRASLGEDDAGLLDGFAERVRCATVRVPRDYADPAGSEITLALLRLAALDPAHRKGSILINPGGPGADGLAYPLMLGAYWISDGATDPAVAPLYQQLAQSFDLVGFSPRGIGASTRLQCVRKRELRFVADPTRDVSDENLANALYNSQVTAESCADNPFTPYVNTDATARDLDLVRHLLGEDKLNFIGMSYGTWLGNWYRSLFPERSGRMLLTGVTDFSQPLNHQSLPQEGGMQRVLDEVLIPYAARYPQRFGKLAADADGLHAMLRALPNELHYAVVHAFDVGGTLAQSTLADAGVMTLLAAKAIQTELAAEPGLGEADLQNRLLAYDFGAAASLSDEAQTAATGLAQSYFAQLGKTQEDDDQGMFWSIVCNDAGTRYTPQDWVAEGNRDRELYPDFGGLKRDNPCLYWPLPAVPRPPQSQATLAGNIVMLQSELDPLTVLAGARSSFDLSPEASFVEIQGEYAHAPLVPYGNRCVDEPIARYFLDGTQPPKETLCERRPLPAEVP